MIISADIQLNLGRVNILVKAMSDSHKQVIERINKVLFSSMLYGFHAKEFTIIKNHHMSLSYDSVDGNSVLFVTIHDETHIFKWREERDEVTVFMDGFDKYECCKQKAVELLCLYI